MPSATSIQNYHEHKRSGKLGQQAQQVLDFLGRNTGRNYSRAEIAHMLGMQLASVCGRINELVAAKLVEARKPRPCSITHKTITPVRFKREEVALH